MSRIQIIEPKTPRLQLRQWTPGDRDAFAVMSADPRVMEFYPDTLSHPGVMPLLKRARR